MIRIGSARIGETGGYNQIAGNQTGNELSMQDYYNHRKQWDVIRLKNKSQRVLIAKAMIKAINNKNIGYDMRNRLSLLNACASFNYDPSKVKVPCECDCSSLVRVCIAYATGKLLPNFHTANERDVCLNSGLFDTFKLTDKSQLVVGDILCTRTQGHTVVVLETDNENVSRETYTKYTGNSNSIIDALNSLKIDSSLSNRIKLANKNNIKVDKNNRYYSMNTQLLKKLKQGNLIV